MAALLSCSLLATVWIWPREIVFVPAMCSRLSAIGLVGALSSWLYASSRRAHAAGVEQLDSSPGWSAVWPWTPIASFKVYWTLDQLERSSRAGTQGRWQELASNRRMLWGWIGAHSPFVLLASIYMIPLVGYILVRFEMLDFMIQLALLAGAVSPWLIVSIMVRIDRQQLLHLHLPVAESSPRAGQRLGWTVGTVGFAVIAGMSTCRSLCAPTGGGIVDIQRP